MGWPGLLLQSQQEHLYKKQVFISSFGGLSLRLHVHGDVETNHHVIQGRSLPAKQYPLLLSQSPFIPA